MGLMLFVVEQYKKVLEFIRVAQEEGATLVCGGKRPDVSYIFLLTFWPGNFLHDWILGTLFGKEECFH